MTVSVGAADRPDAEDRLNDCRKIVSLHHVLRSRRHKSDEPTTPGKTMLLAQFRGRRETPSPDSARWLICKDKTCIGCRVAGHIGDLLTSLEWKDFLVREGRGPTLRVLRGSSSRRDNYNPQKSAFDSQCLHRNVALIQLFGELHYEKK